MTDMLHCEDAAEYVSALADGETIPSAFAQHIGFCPACQSRLHDYLATGAELRRIASLDRNQVLPALSIEKQRTTRSIWKKGLETMRIPKFAFALLILAVVVLASSLTIVKVGAHSSGSVLMLAVAVPDGSHFKCPLDVGHYTPATCGVMGLVGAHSMSGYQFAVLARDGDRVQLGVRTKVTPMSSPGRQSMEIADLIAQPQSQYWFEPGQTLKLNVEAVGTLSITGEWMDHIPAMVDESQLDPRPNELRVASPLLLRDKEVLGDIEGASAIAPDPHQAVTIYLPGTGRFLLSLAPMKGAVQASVRMNRLSFKLDGKEYAFVTGTPLTRADNVWVLYQPDFKPPEGVKSWYIGSGELSQIAPEAVPPQSPANH